MTLQEFVKLDFSQRLDALRYRRMLSTDKRWGHDVWYYSFSDFSVRLFWARGMVVRITAAPYLELSLSEFNRLPHDKKSELLEVHGRHLTTRKWGKCEVDLYHLPFSGRDARSPQWLIYDLFVEVYHDQGGQVVRFKAFRNTKGLQPYVKKISLADLFTS